MNKPESIPMLRRVYAVRDDKQNEYNTPVLIPNDAVASRSFGDMISTDKNSLIARHPGDYSLWFLGTFDAERGIFSQDEKPYVVARASDFAVKE